ncbi:MAG: extracellular solute-binding protein [Acidiferrobacteraceae bacterium]
MRRRTFFKRFAGVVLASRAGRLPAGRLTVLQVAYAGSMGALMDQGVRPVVARSLGIALQGRGQGAFALAHLIVAGSIRPDIFISITPGPMQVLLAAGRVQRAIPVARTEMVLAYSRDSRFASRLESQPPKEPWWRLLEDPHVRFGRTDPRTDPQGLNIIFLMELAQRYYHAPGLAARILGPLENPRQIFPEAEVMARLQSGQLDAGSAYKTQPSSFGLPFLSLPSEINLGDAGMERRYRDVSAVIGGVVHRPQALVFYAALLRDAPAPAAGRRFMDWLAGPQAASTFARYHYDLPGDATVLVPPHEGPGSVK